jgi:uncharacterized protein
VSSLSPLAQALQNDVLAISLLAGFTAQGLKLVFTFFQTGKLDLRVLVQAGGMPSSHSALVTALATGVGIKRGFDSVEFAIASIMAFIVMYDAAGVRQAAGKQARILNKMIEDLFTEKPQYAEKRLKELLGHTPVQVIAGAVLGGMFMSFLATR